MTDADIIALCMPDLAGGELEPIGEGDFTRAYRAGGPGGRVVRVPKHAEARRALEREACLLPGIAPTLPLPVPMPAVVRAEDEAWAVAVHDELPGVPLRRDRWAALPAADRRRVAGSVGGFLRAVHATDVRTGLDCGLPVVPAAALAAQVSGRLEEDTGRVPVALTSLLGRCLDELQGEHPDFRPRAVLHGDFGPGHTLYDPDAVEVTGVIDWGDAFVGDPARDFIFVFEDWGDEFLGQAVAAYGPDDPEWFVERVYLHYLSDQLGWVLEATAGDAIAEGVDGLRRALVSLEAVRSAGSG